MIHYLFLALYLIVVLVTVTVGFGAVISTRFGTRSGPPGAGAKTDMYVDGAAAAPRVSPPPPVIPPPGPKNATE